MTNTTNPLAAALENVTAQAATVTEWAAELDAAEAAQRDAEARRPQTPADSATVAQQRVAARERVTVARDALDTAKACELGARRAAVAAEADSMAGTIRDAHKAVEAFRARLAELLKPLQEHTGLADWGIGRTIRHHVLGVVRESAPTSPRELELIDRVRVLEATQDLLRRAASGELLNVPVGELPPSLQADGVCPDPRALDAAQDARARQADADAWAATVAAWQAEADAAAKVLGVEAPDVLATEGEHTWAQANAQEWRDRANAASDVGQAPPAQFDVLARLCGPYAAERAVTQWRTQGAAPEAASADAVA